MAGSAAHQQYIVVIGAGVAGLAAARRLTAAGARVTVLERGPIVGGRVATVEAQGCRYELGAEFLASFYTRTLSLIDELGLRAELRRIPSSAAVLRAGRLHSLWASARVAFTPLVGPRHKLALSYLFGSLVRHGPLLDLRAFHRAYPIDDASVSDYARAHLSDDLLEYVLQPPLAGIFYWTPERTSRALLLLVLRAGLSRPSGLQLFTMREGLGQIPRALAAGIDVRTCAEALAIEPLDDAGYRVHLRQGETCAELVCDGVLCATTASVVPRLLPWLSPERQAFFAAVSYSTTAQLAIGTRRRLPRGFYGLLFPRRETPLLASATIQTVKDSEAAPRGRDVICLHMAGPAAAALAQCDDSVLGEVMLSELRRLAPRYNPGPHISFQRISRWAEALPEFDVGHFGRLREFANGAIEQDGLAFAGDYLGGPFVEGAILSGEQAAERLLGRLSNRI